MQPHMGSLLLVLYQEQSFRYVLINYISFLKDTFPPLR